MTSKVKQPRFSKNQLKILDILEKYDELTAKDIAEILWARNIHCRGPEFSSTSRSLRTLYRKGLVERVGGRIKWRKKKKSSRLESHRDRSKAIRLRYID